MKTEKITAAEVQLLRDNAEKERTRHALTMELIHKIGVSNSTEPLSQTSLMDILTHKRESEIIELLDVYDKKGKKEFIFPEEAQLFIYDDTNKMPAAKEHMIKNHCLCYAVEQRIFIDDKLLFFAEDGQQNREFYPHFSQEGEEFIVKETLANCLKVDHITTELYFLTGYIKNHELSPLAQIALMDFLTPDTYSDRLTEELSDFVIDYIAKYKTLAFTAQLKLIRSGDHALIMYYITNSAEGIQTKEVLDALIKRGDREEITAYFNRYANEE